jgi:hypothetical protein
MNIYYNKLDCKMKMGERKVAVPLLCLFILLGIWIYICMNVCIYMYIFTYINICMYTYLSYVYVYAYTYVCIDKNKFIML